MKTQNKNAAKIFVFTSIFVVILSALAFYTKQEVKYTGDVTPPFCDGQNAIANALATMILNRAAEQGDLLDIYFDGKVDQEDANLIASLPCLRPVEDRELITLGISRSMDMAIRSLWHKAGVQGYHIALDTNANGEVDINDLKAILAALSGEKNLADFGLTYNLTEPTAADIGRAYANWILSTKDANGNYDAWYYFDLNGSGVDPVTGKYTVNDLDVEIAQNIATVDLATFLVAYKKMWVPFYNGIGRNVGEKNFETFTDLNNDGRNDMYDYKTMLGGFKKGRPTANFLDRLSLPPILPIGSLTAEHGQIDVIIGDDILPTVKERMILYFGMNNAYTTTNPRGLGWGVGDPSKNGWYTFLENYGDRIVEWGSVWVHNPAGAWNFNDADSGYAMQLTQILDAIREKNPGGTTFEGAWTAFLNQHPQLKTTTNFYIGACRLDRDCYTVPVGCTEDSCKDYSGKITETTDKASVDAALNLYLSSIAPILRTGVSQIFFDANADSPENSVDFVMAELLRNPALRNINDPTNPYRMYTEVINNLVALRGYDPINVGIEAKSKASNPHWGNQKYDLTLLDSAWNSHQEYSPLYLRNTDSSRQFRIATTESPQLNDFSQTMTILMKGFFSVLNPSTTMIASRNIYGVTGMANLAPLIAANIPVINNQMKLYGVFSSNYFDSYHILTQPKYGTLRRSQDYDRSVFEYTPNGTCSPVDGFDYRISDGTNGSNVAHFTITPSCQVECLTSADCNDNQVCATNKCEDVHSAPPTICRNGTVDSIDEKCDDGNRNNGDGCDEKCLIEAGYTCSGQPSLCVQKAICGNGKVDSVDEKCDDGNKWSNDGCSVECKVEPGYVCTGSPSICVKKGKSGRK